MEITPQVRLWSFKPMNLLHVLNFCGGSEAGYYERTEALRGGGLAWRTGSWWPICYFAQESMERTSFLSLDRKNENSDSITKDSR